MEAPEEAELCFPRINSSCRRTLLPHSELIFSVLSCITLLTVALNLLVIISISHFRQLHTTTNLLLLSLAVADFCVGVLQMPALLLHNQGCWYLGDLMCGAHYFIGFIVISVSVGSMVLISVDRYIAICEPMFYTSKVTLRRVKLSVCLCWMFSTVHSSWILRDFLKEPGRFNSCYGNCVVVVNFAEGLVDLVVTLLGPILIIAVLYLRVFAVAVSQARAMRGHIAAVEPQRSGTVTVKKAEMKAARTLGIVVVVFLICFCPYYFPTLAGEDTSVDASSAAVEIWLTHFNSCLNPVIYAFFYPWFRKCIKLILTLKILKPGSRDIKLL
ncbi:trace amine-associated receptor 8a-like [Hippoglossus hippoglossus]|uniref:trace amine-associated receptor 8a-like n=1 Tax=Hippoglossus hippoglossus TaxID=8267 RepID=UPI00148CCC1B|nr:trace amine-associated receptor 8a-like [Hippoglossus hippoglossus]XP_034431059.1 trace amine-associated receptor 8a-like [Hippoglossus hippoglossus]